MVAGVFLAAPSSAHFDKTAALLPWQFDASVCGLVHQGAHFEMRRLEVHGKSVLAEFFRSHWPDRADQNLGEHLTHIVFQIHFRREAHKVRDLNRGSEEGHINFSLSDCRNRCP